MAHSCRSAPARRNPTHEEIAALAYFYWEARGRVHGFAVEDWLKAERELRREAEQSRVSSRWGEAGRRPAVRGRHSD